MSASIRPDGFSQYAPRWVREQTERPGDPVRLPPAPQLIMSHMQEPPWLAMAAEHVQQWRLPQVTEPYHHAPERSLFSVSTKVLGAAAFGLFGALVVGQLGTALFPSAPNVALQIRWPSFTPAVAAKSVPTLHYEERSAKSAFGRIVPVEQVLAAPTPIAETASVVDTPASPTPAFVTASTTSTIARQTQPPQLAPPQVEQAPTTPTVAPETTGVANTPPAAKRFVVASTAMIVPQTEPLQQPVQHAMPQRVEQPVPQRAHDQEAQSPSQPTSARVVSADEVNTLIKRAEMFLGQGDIAAARLFLSRAAETRDARAALMMGSTYDAEALKRMHVLGIRPDPEQAQAWYARAAEYGSGEAKHLLAAAGNVAR